MHSVRFITLGCRLNQAEEAIFAGGFAEHGWNVAFDDKPADVVVLHSCAVTRQAERTTLQELRALKRNAPDGFLPFVVVTGCATQAITDELLVKSGADLVVKRGDDGDLCVLVERMLAQGRAPLPLEDAPECAFPKSPRSALPKTIPVASAAVAAVPSFAPIFRYGEKALLKVQDGCDFRCAYCIVPFTRGPSVSLPFDDLVASALRIAAMGSAEIVLTGCNLACYSYDGRDLADLATAICEAVRPHGTTISLGSLEPAICDEKIISAMLSHGNFKRFVHLPIQSGDGKVLALAGRRYDGDEIRKVLSLYRDKLPGVVLGADFITGLPGEDEAAFEKTACLVKDFRFEELHVFPYSPRPGTKAAHMNSCPSRTVAKERAARLRQMRS